MNIKKKLKNLTLMVTILVLSGNSQVMAAEDWSSVYDNYKDAEYGKIISGNDYQNAIKAINEHYKPDKKVKNKLEKKGLNLDKDEDENKIIFESPSRKEPLLTLPINISYDGKLIPKGFYLAKGLNRDNKYFIRLTQGEGRIIADIEANIFKTDNLQKVSESKEKIFSEIINNDMLKITYSNKIYILEAYLWIQ